MKLLPQYLDILQQIAAGRKWETSPKGYNIWTVAEPMWDPIQCLWRGFEIRILNVEQPKATCHLCRVVLTHNRSWTAEGKTYCEPCFGLRP